MKFFFELLIVYSPIFLFAAGLLFLSTQRVKIEENDFAAIFLILFPFFIAGWVGFLLGFKGREKIREWLNRKF